MNYDIKNVVKVSKWMKNGYLERDYEYLTKVGFIKSEYENPRLNLVISTIDKNKMYGGLSTAVKLYRYLAEYLEMDMRIIMTAESIKSEIMEQYPDFVCMESGQDSDAHKTVCTVDVCNHSRGKAEKNGSQSCRTDDESEAPRLQGSGWGSPRYCDAGR